MGRHSRYPGVNRSREEREELEERERLRREGALSTTSAPQEILYAEGEIPGGEGEIVLTDGGELDGSVLTDEERAAIEDAVAELIDPATGLPVEVSDPQVEGEGSDAEGDAEVTDGEGEAEVEGEGSEEADVSDEVAETYPADGNIAETLRWVEVDPEARTAYAVAREQEREHPRKGVLDVLTAEDD